jgi:hypothetical protein
MNDGRDSILLWLGGLFIVAAFAVARLLIAVGG